MPRSTRRGFTPQEADAWSGFLAVHSLVTRQLDALLGAEHGMPIVEYEVLLKLAAAGGRLRMSDLADAAFLSRSGLTRIVDELEDLGLVTREPDEHDGRVLLATLTPLGRRRFAAARRSHLTHVRDLFLGEMTNEEQTQLARLWGRLIASMESRDAPRHRQRSRSRRSAVPDRRPAGRPG